jgi:hypothetical protein
MTNASSNVSSSSIMARGVLTEQLINPQNNSREQRIRDRLKESG